MKQKIQKKIEKNIPTIEQAWEWYYDEKVAQGIADMTRQTYYYAYKAYITYHGFDPAETPISEMTQATMYKWMNHMRNEELSDYSIRHYIGNLRSFLNWCMDDTRNYIEPYKIKMAKPQEAKLKVYTDDELYALLVRPSNSSTFVEWRTWAIVNFILGTGARAGTVVSLRVEDINFKNKEIYYRHLKNKKAQTVPLSSGLENVLREYIKMWRDNPESYLFPNVGDEPLRVEALHAAYARYCKNRDVEQTNIHALRHTFAREWVRNNGNIFALQRILGHSALDMTRRYVALFGEDLKKDYESFSALDTLKKNTRRKQTVKKSF